MPMQPGSFAAQMPAGEDGLIRRIQEIERVQREFMPSVAASFGPVVADLQAQIAAQVNVASFGDYAQGFTVSTTAEVAVATATVTVPDGYGRALVFVFGTLAVTNTGSDHRTIQGRCTVTPPGGATVQGSQMPQGLEGYEFGSLGAHTRDIFTGLTGGTITATLTARASSGTGTLNSGTNRADLDCFAVFLR